MNDHGSRSLLRIGELAKLVDAPPDTPRYYERLGLVEPARRSRAGYRLYDRSAVERMSFIRKARALGLTLEEVRDVLRAASDGTGPCEHVRETLELRMREVDERIGELTALRRTLARALERSRELPLAGGCVCGIIESQELPEDGRSAPPVTIRTDGTVTIGEDSDVVTLEREEWNVLVDLIRSGVLDELRG